jgi:hypothetical protein
VSFQGERDLMSKFRSVNDRAVARCGIYDYAVVLRASFTTSGRKKRSTRTCVIAIWSLGVEKVTKKMPWKKERKTKSITW